MKKEEFSKALGEIDEKYVNEAIEYKASEEASQDLSKTKNFRKSMKVWRAIAIAACALIVVAGGIAGIAAIVSTNGAKSSSSYITEGYYDEYAYSSDASYDAVPNEIAEENYFDNDIAGSTDKGMGATVDATSTIPESNFKIIYTAYMRLETSDFDAATSNIETIVNANGGYFEQANVNSSSYAYRNAYYTIRIPAENLDSFLTQTKGVCTVVSVNKSAEDVSESYFDIETRLNTAKTKLTRLNELLAQATSMEDIITLESAISETQLLIDSLSGSLQHYDSLINYSTVNIDLSEVYKEDTSKAPLTFGEKISTGFKSGIKSFGIFLEGFAVFIASSWIWLIIIAGVIVAIIFIIKAIVKKNRK